MWFSNIGTTDNIMLQLKSMWKELSESSDKFSQRIMKIYNELMTIYDTAPNISTLERDTKRFATERDALNHFIMDMGMPLDAQVRTLQPRTLSEAINRAIEFDNQYSMRFRQRQASVNVIQAETANNEAIGNLGAQNDNGSKKQNNTQNKTPCAVYGKDNHI